MEEFKFAVVQSADNDGVIVLFEGEESPSPKKYTRLQSCNCVEGERVLMAPASGSYVVIGVVDRKKIITADSAATANIANSATNAKNATNATNASSADTADQLKTSRKISLTGDVTASGSFNGSANLSMAATGVKANAVKDQNYTSARTVLFRVLGSGTTLDLQFKSSYYDSSYWHHASDGTRA